MSHSTIANEQVQAILDGIHAGVRDSVAASNGAVPTATMAWDLPRGASRTWTRTLSSSAPLPSPRPRRWLPASQQLLAPMPQSTHRRPVATTAQP